jgi:NAD(P)-dependent dehydrogenase (short-subunit alcohol dehydrogenase family)
MSKANFSICSRFAIELMADNFFDVRGRVAIVTGASSGLGKHFSGLLAGHGAHVVAAARRIDRVERLVAEIEKSGGTATGVACDVCDDDSIANCISHAIATYGCPQILVNNAGISVPKPALKLERSDWDKVVATNLTGTWIMAQKTATAMVAHGVKGSIINITSIAGAARTYAGVTPYVATKAGVVGLTKNLAVELAAKEIRVNAIAPGLFDTELGAGYRREDDPDRRPRMIARIPFGRLGEYEELDGALLLLASDASSYMTASVLFVDGGYSETSIA